MENLKLSKYTEDYLKKIEQIKPLTKEEEQKYLKLKNLDKKAKNTLIKTYLKNVPQIAKKYIGNGIELSDLIQEGNIGVIKAIENYDLNSNTNFNNYINYNIWTRIICMTKRKSQLIKLTQKEQENIPKLKKAENKLWKKLGKKPTNEDLVDEMGITISEVQSLKTVTKQTVSLSNTIKEIKEHNELKTEKIPLSNFYYEEENTNLTECIKNKNAEKQFDKVINKIYIKELTQLIDKILKEDEKNLIILKFGFNNNECKTYEELSEIYGKSKKEIKSLEKKILRKLKSNSEFKNFISLNDKINNTTCEIKNKQKTRTI